MTDEAPKTGPQPEEKPEARLQATLDRVKAVAAEVVAAWIKRPIAEVGAWLQRKIMLFAIGLVLLCVAIVFVLVGGVQGLQKANVPEWATYLGVGVIAGLTGVILLRSK